jgi:repressor LexA
MAIIENKTVFARNLRHFIERDKVQQKDVAAAINVSTGTLCDWVKGRSFPRMDKLQLLADYFKIEKSDLIEDRTAIAKLYLETEAKNIAKEFFESEEDFKLYLRIKGLSEKDKKIVDSLISNLEER